MKIVNNELETLDNKKVEITMIEINNLLLQFLKQEYKDVMIINELDNKIDNLVIELLPSIKEKYMTIYNGEKHSHNTPTYAGAFVTKISQLHKDNKWFFANGIVFPFSFENTKMKKKIHEYFHFLSSNQIIEKVNEYYYDKVGLRFVTYDEEDNVVDNKYSCAFLNEGMTEYLASKVTNTNPDAYELNVMMIELLTINNHNELIEAYFSSDYQKIIDYKELFEKHSGHSFETIFNNDQYGINIEPERTEEMILSSISFQINLASSIEELDAIIDNICNVLNKYCNSLNIVFDIEKLKIEMTKIADDKRQSFIGRKK